MNDPDPETLADWLAIVQELGEYPEWLRREHKKRVIRLNDAKELLRSSTQSLENSLPQWWRVLIAGAMHYTGEAILSFAGRVKLWIRAESFLGRLWNWFTGEPLEMAAKFGAFFGLKSETPKSIGGVLIKAATPTSSGTSVAVSKIIFHVTALGILAQRLNSATVGDDHAEVGDVFTNAYKSKIRNNSVRGTAGYMVLPQPANARRYRRKVRSRG